MFWEVTYYRTGHTRFVKEVVYLELNGKREVSRWWKCARPGTMFLNAWRKKFKGL